MEVEFALAWPAGLACFLMVVCWAAAPCVADTITLHEKAFVKGPKVVLGDLADIQGEHAAELATVEVAPAPPPGGSKVLDASLVASRIQEAGIATENLEMKGAPHVRATTRSLEVTPDTILGDLRRFIQQEMPWDPQQATVDVALPNAAGGFLVPDGDISIRWVPDPEYRWVGSGAFRGELAVDGEVKRTFLCKAAVDAFGDMVVAAQDIPQNAQISLENLAMARKARSILREPGFEDPIEVAGQVAKVAISAGQVITRRMISPPRLVRRNQVVTVEVRLSNVLVVSRAKALADGRKGDVVRCQALGSREELQGVVREDGTVVIE